METAVFPLAINSPTEVVMKLKLFGKRNTSPAPPDRPTISPFPGSLEDTETLKYHGIRALCGMLMDRHDDCPYAHPFCGPHVHRQGGDVASRFIAHIIPQGRESSSEADIVAIYFCKTVNGLPVAEEYDPLEFTRHMRCAETTPSRKMTAQLVSDGSYYVRYGEILNPTEGDHSTGRLNQETAVELRGVPEPAHTRWEYYDPQIASGPLRIVPEVHCLQIFGEWWIVDVDRERGARQQVAALTVANNPHHLTHRFVGVRIEDLRG